ncbi:hypothetical protein ACFQJC_00680 [Haloferax namakaokahaiae]|uniref:Uncharacterized protein n=1 Tax=Haloferax namakaokahaiae TaxID=1748331 RepID=A0ABD5ZAH8_9EURY
MEEPDWAEIVRVLYQQSPNLPTGEINRSHPFVVETDLNRLEANKSVETLEEWGLVEREEIKSRWDSPGTGGLEGEREYGYKLTSDGFDVAHERELSARDNQINNSLVFLTFILVLAQIIGVLPLADWAKVLSGFVVLIGMLGIILRTDLLAQ